MDSLLLNCWLFQSRMIGFIVMESRHHVLLLFLRCITSSPTHLYFALHSLYLESKIENGHSISLSIRDQKRRRKRVDGAIARAISKMAVASRLRPSVVEKCSDKFTGVLDELERVNHQVYLTWLTSKLSGPP
ncbi:hypothetical protein KY290_023705 [Solanum tuberosum]|uniref:Uncharacterized protein n=1 Tax=Solanum tuberosum TaxID=4113 RepID=A0ABQ7V809_SOLTU|nr:hypothetical protein KY284_022616 [Solanum tuberosum]KAH0684375.1 hypothetical protein KY289_022127 [Solanum tuberosum]KAH0694791.1 hypothetical protein KY285_021888 [Solanum tuberosum]KAH0760212.1 hypothetical protein KY290_023705 [Solanum tuberosum]